MVRSQRLWSSDLANRPRFSLFTAEMGANSFSALGQDPAVALAQIPVLSIGQALAGLFATRAGLLQQALHILRPAIGVGLDHEGQLAQQMRAAQAMVEVIRRDTRLSGFGWQCLYSGE